MFRNGRTVYLGQVTMILSVEYENIAKSIHICSALAFGFCVSGRFFTDFEIYLTTQAFSGCFHLRQYS